MLLSALGFDFDGEYTILELGYLAAKWRDWSFAYAAARQTPQTPRTPSLALCSAPRHKQPPQESHAAPLMAFPPSPRYVNFSMVAAYWGFLVICPLMRALTLLILLLLPLSRERAVQIYRLSRYASYFYAYEVSPPVPLRTSPRPLHSPAPVKSGTKPLHAAPLPCR